MLFACAGCRRSEPQTRRSLNHPTVASLVPAATDLLLAMGAGDHLVAVSNFEPARAEIAALPKVGDYESTDWEKLAELRPDVMLIFMSPAQTPPGLVQRAEELRIRVMNLKTDTLADIFTTIDELGVATNVPEKAAELSKALHRQLEAVQARHASGTKVKAVLSLGDNAFDLVGRRTYLDELLTIAGGENDLPDGPAAYPTVDRERLIDLQPSVVIQLAPAASDDWKRRAERMWRTLPTPPRVVTIDDAYALQPGAHVGQIAERMEMALRTR